jgi:hypothetical protein
VPALCYLSSPSVSLNRLAVTIQRVAQQLELPDGPRERMNSLHSLIDDLHREITTTTRRIDTHARVDQRVTVLTQIPGVGSSIAMLIIAEVARSVGSRPPDTSAPGPESRRPFAAPTGKPASGTSRTRGRTSCAGRSPKPPSASPAAADRCGRYERIAKRRGSRAAKVAVARQILTLCYYGLRDGEIRCLDREATNPDDGMADAA